MLVAVAGTLNPSSGDVSLFLPTEQAALAHTADGPARTLAFAWYNLAGTLAGAFGALLSGVPSSARLAPAASPSSPPSAASSSSTPPALSRPPRLPRLSPAVEVDPDEQPRHPLAESRSVVLRLAALFSLDSFGGGFVVQSLLVLWLFRRFHLDERDGRRRLLRRRNAERLLPDPFTVGRRPHRPHPHDGLHAPARQHFSDPRRAHADGGAQHRLLAPADGCVADGRSCPPGVRHGRRSTRGAHRRLQRHQRSEEPRRRPRAAHHRRAARQTTFGWPLVIGGALKAIYDVLLLVQFRSVATLEEGVR